jgi:hypothetical protein
MPPTMWRQHLINPCSEQDQADRWHPKARVFWSEGRRALEQGLVAPFSLTFDSKTAADSHATRQLARLWIDRLIGSFPPPAAQAAQEPGRLSNPTSRPRRRPRRLL